MSKQLQTTHPSTLPIKNHITESDYLISSSPTLKRIKVKDITRDLERNNSVLRDDLEDTKKRVSDIVANNGDGTKDSELVDARKGEKSLRDKINKVDDCIDYLSVNLENVNRQLLNYPNAGGKKYGVRFYKNSSNPVGERVGDAVGLIAAVGVNDERVVNDFDSIYPWGNRRVCNLGLDGRVAAYEGDPTFKRDGSNGDVMVETPLFYQKYVDTPEYYEYWIADYNAPGFRISPRFKKKDGTILNHIYTGAYKAGLVDNKLVSISEIFPKVDSGRHTFRNFAKAKGSGWGLIDIAYRCDILNYLFYVEFATRNSQALMQGLTTFVWDYKTTAATDNSNVLTLDSNNIAVGFTLRVNNTDRRVLSVDSETKMVVVDGEPFTVASGVAISSRGWISGATDGVKSSSGSMISNSDGKNCCVYRGEENPWGNIWEWIDGCNIKDHQAYVHWIPDEYADDKFTEPYNQVGYVQPKTNSFVKEMGYDESNPYVQLPITIGASSSTYFCDNYYQSVGNKAPRVGAYLDSGVNAGLSSWSCAYGFTYSDRNFGARLSYKPS